ncbi:MAG: hypothetical protein AAFR62_08725, partial [Cyanobacteria bacterium J06629_2]
SNKDISRKRTKYERQPKNNQLEPSKHLIAKIERERDYFHTCIYSHRLLRRKTTEPAVTVGQY